MLVATWDPQVADEGGEGWHCIPAAHPHTVCQ
jgi:hypothetical protein